jgi:dephospho-CoA kinase
MSASPDDKSIIKAKLTGCKVVCVMGGPCSGKKEMAQMMHEELGYMYISTGELLRKEILKVSNNKRLF